MSMIIINDGNGNDVAMMITTIMMGMMVMATIVMAKMIVAVMVT